MEAQVPAQRGASGVLADRMAAALVHREPGWQLPRRSALARRYNVSMAEMMAIGELARRSLIRRLPDGQLYRASPAEYLIPVEGIGGLSTQLDPMGGEISCQARHVSQRDAPQDVAWALGAAGRGEVRIIRCVWAVGAEPVAISTAYVPGTAAGRTPTTWRRSRPPCRRRRRRPRARRRRTRGRWTSSWRRRSRRSRAACGCRRASPPSRSRSGSTTRRRVAGRPHRGHPQARSVPRRHPGRGRAAPGPDPDDRRYRHGGYIPGNLE